MLSLNPPLKEAARYRVALHGTVLPMILEWSLVSLYIACTVPCLLTPTRPRAKVARPRARVTVHGSVSFIYIFGENAILCISALRSS